MSSPQALQKRKKGHILLGNLAWPVSVYISLFNLLRRVQKVWK